MKFRCYFKRDIIMEMCVKKFGRCASFEKKNIAKKFNEPMKRINSRLEERVLSLYSIHYRVNWFNCLVANFMSRRVDGEEYVKRFCRNNLRKHFFDKSGGVAQ